MERAESTKKEPQKAPIPEERVIVYIDGFNLYFGLKTKGWSKYLWLDLDKMCRSLLRRKQVLVAIKYFTSRIRKPMDKAERQNRFLEAVETLPNVQIFYGNYQINKKTCKNCGAISHIPNEKMTDVNIATEMLTDAFYDRFDTALLVSADSDLRIPVERIVKTIGKRLVLIYPPERRSYSLEEVASAKMSLGKQHLDGSQFPTHVTKADGFILSRPASWPPV